MGMEGRNEGTNGVLVGAVLLPLSFFPSPFLLPELDQRQNNAKESLDIAKGGSPYDSCIQAKECFTARY